jgi:molecular chaperone DnaK (HSP70)
MIVDCGGGTVDLTTRKLIDNKRLGEITERIGDFCGSTFIDNEFVNFLRERLGTRAIDLLIENHYNQFQRIVQRFCRRVKIPFTGDNTRFCYELEIDEYAPDLLEYVSKETRQTMEDKYWVIDIKFNDIKKMFDPIVERIIRMIHIQLLNSRNNKETCSAMFLVGGFSENIYLQKRIKQEFRHTVKTISVPTNPVSAVVYGAAMYGLSLKNSSKTDEINNFAFAIHTRVLKFTYGIKVLGVWKEGEHPPHRKIHGNRIYLFDTFVKRGTQVEVGKKSSPKRGYTPLNPSQTGLRFELYKTLEYSAKYHDEPGMELVGTLRIVLPDVTDVHLACKVSFGFYFGDMEITAFANNELNGQNFQTKFYLRQDF